MFKALSFIYTLLYHMKALTLHNNIISHNLKNACFLSQCVIYPRVRVFQPRAGLTTPPCVPRGYVLYILTNLPHRGSKKNQNKEQHTEEEPHMIIGWTGAIGLMYCILILPQTAWGQQKMKDRFNNDLMYMYVTFLLMAIFGFIFQI